MQYLVKIESVMRQDELITAIHNLAYQQEIQVGRYDRRFTIVYTGTGAYAIYENDRSSILYATGVIEHLMVPLEELLETGHYVVFPYGKMSIRFTSDGWKVHLDDVQFKEAVPDGRLIEAIKLLREAHSEHYKRSMSLKGAKEIVEFVRYSSTHVLFSDEWGIFQEVW